MDDEQDLLVRTDHRVDEAGEIFAMGGEPIGIGTGIG
jgi:hypothetical protein